MPKLTKNQKAARLKIDRDATYSPVEALALVKETACAKFDETVEVHMHLGIDTRQADQQVRGSINYPNGLGREVRVAVFAEGDKAREAEEAGADVVGSDELIADIQKGFLEFDAAIATPDMMSKVGRLGKVLGPHGLMPNPKLGTVTNDIKKIIDELKAGRVEYRADRAGNIHVPVGKVSFDLEALVGNYSHLIEEIMRVKPSASKGKYLKNISFSSTMGMGVRVDTTATRGISLDKD
jgi:large subunit ribosomal protein L1